MFLLLSLVSSQQLCGKNCIYLIYNEKLIIDVNGDIEEITIPAQTIYSRTYNSTTIADKTSLLRDTALEAFRAYETDTTKRLYYIEYSVKVPDEISYCVAIPYGSEGEYVENIPDVRALSVYHHR